MNGRSWPEADLEVLMLNEHIESSLKIITFSFLGMLLVTVGQFATSQEISKDLQNRIAERFAEGDTPGLVVAIAVNNEVIYEEGFGVRDVESRLPELPISFLEMARRVKC